MFEDALLETTEGLEGLVSALAHVGAAPAEEVGGPVSESVPVSDVVRIDQLAVLERVKAAVAAAQARVTAAFVDSQEQVAQAWRERARECSDAGDFEGWRAARDQARSASLDDGDGQGEAAGFGGSAGDPAGGAAGGGDACAGGSRGRRRRSSGMAGVAAQVGLARRESPVQGAGHVRLALALVRDMPHTLAALEAGELSEWRAQILVRETATLSRGDRSLVDAEVVGEPSEPVARLGDRELARRVRAVAYRVDAASVLARAAKAQAERRVTLRPAPDTMAYLTALLPVAQAVAAQAALTAAADAAKAAGDERGKGQVMADTLVERVTGQVSAEAVPVEVQLVMSVEALLAGDDTPAQLRGYGTVPAQWARNLLGGFGAPSGCGPRRATDVFGRQGCDPDVDETGGRKSDARELGAGEVGAGEVGAGELGTAENGGGNWDAPVVDGRRADSRGDGRSVSTEHVEQTARVWLRRLFAHPATGALVAMDSTRRTFDGGLRRFLLARDAGACRTPWCDAPARHVDHVHDHADGGPTSAANGQGLCVRCNLTKQLPGFSATAVTGEEPGASHTVETRTPTGHTYTSQAPPLLPGLQPRPPRLPEQDRPPDLSDPKSLSPLERVLASALAA